MNGHVKDEPKADYELDDISDLLKIIT